MRSTAGYLAAAVGEGLGGGVTEVGSLEVGGEVVEEGDVVYLEWVSFLGWKEEGPDLCYFSEADDTNS